LPNVSSSEMQNQFVGDVDNMSMKSAINTNKISIKGGIQSQNARATPANKTIRGGAGRSSNMAGM